MQNENMANFICELRKAKNMTQKQLAEKLDITDKAVSKWERGAGYPDITLLVRLAEILGVTTNELLSGRREEAIVPKADIIIQNTLQYAEKVTSTSNKKARRIMKYILTISSLLAILVCVICDLAISKRLSWSLYPIAGIVFAWLVLVPLFHFEKRKFTASLISLTIFIIPFLFCIERTGGTAKWLIPLGAPVSLASLAYLWTVRYLFKKMQNKWYASGIAIMMALALSFYINYIVSKLTWEPYFDVWDAMAIGIAAVAAIILFTIGSFGNRNTE